MYKYRYSLFLLRIKKRKQLNNVCLFFLYLDSSIRNNLQCSHEEDGDGDPNGSDVPSGSTSSTNPRFPLRISRL
jgi:hypothetical protein